MLPPNSGLLWRVFGGGAGSSGRSAGGQTGHPAPPIRAAPGIACGAADPNMLQENPHTRKPGPYLRVGFLFYTGQALTGFPASYTRLLPEIPPITRKDLQRPLSRV